MTVYGLIFYLLAGFIVATTGYAVTRRNMAHAVVYLVVSFFGSAILFYMLGAPLLAALEVIIYAGAIMILFLFIIMMIRIETLQELMFPSQQLVPALLVTGFYLLLSMLLAVNDPGVPTRLEAAVALPVVFGQFLFQNHWLAIEIASLLLLVALIGALIIGRPPARTKGEAP